MAYIYALPYLTIKVVANKITPTLRGYFKYSLITEW